MKEYGRLDGACVGGLHPGVDRQAEREAWVAESNRQTVEGAAGIGSAIGGVLRWATGITQSEGEARAWAEYRDSCASSSGTQEIFETVEALATPAVSRLFGGTKRFLPRNSAGDIVCPDGFVPQRATDVARRAELERKIRNGEVNELSIEDFRYLEQKGLVQLSTDPFPGEEAVPSHPVEPASRSAESLDAELQRSLAESRKLAPAGEADDRAIDHEEEQE